MFTEFKKICASWKTDSWLWFRIFLTDMIIYQARTMITFFSLSPLCLYRGEVLYFRCGKLLPYSSKIKVLRQNVQIEKRCYLKVLNRRSISHHEELRVSPRWIFYLYLFL